jgi:uncharacterized protein YqgV (UPF0045/DUF77 family)
MAISAQASLYPLRQERLSPAIQVVSETLTARGLHPQIAPMFVTVQEIIDLVAFLKHPPESRAR